MGGLKRLVVLGSTGSLGVQALEVARAFPARLQVVGLAAGANQELLAAQIAQFRPRWAHLAQGSPPPGDYQPARPEEMAAHPEVDLVVVVTSGKAGLSPTLAALGAGKRVALANKEVLVMAGELVTQRARAGGGEILPLDSEHSAIWQCLRGEEDNAIARLILTASGGPFRNLSRQEMAGVSAAQALAHPTWRMGKKVTIDAATLMNKGMEVIEARWLFSVPYPRIEVVIHPQSLVHSLVEFADGALKAQLSYPDMRLPLQYALSHPERWENPALPRLRPEALSRLTFEPPDLERFPCLRLARQAALAGGTYPACLAAADEVAVSLFLEGRMGFLDIPGLVEAALARHQGIPRPTLEDILEADARTRAQVLAEAGR